MKNKMYILHKHKGNEQSNVLINITVTLQTLTKVYFTLRNEYQLTTCQDRKWSMAR